MSNDSEIQAFLDEYRAAVKRMNEDTSNVVNLGPFRIRCIDTVNDSDMYLIGPPNQRGDLVPERCGRIINIQP